MAYTNAWSEITPAGTDAANTADDAIRRLRLDLRERMADLVVSWNADPIVAQAKILGNVVGKTLIIPGAAFITNSDNTGYHPGMEVFNNGSVQIYDHVAVAGVPIPVGCSITAVDILIQTAIVGPTVINFRRFTYDVANTATIIATANKAIGALSLVALAGGGLPHVVLDTTRYEIDVEPAGSSSNLVYGARVTYTTPDSRNTR